MIEDKIEIVIPTYNRANYLNNTLNYLLNSPFKNCKITIRDNASDDETPAICKKYSNFFNNFNIIRIDKNIGGGENILRAYEKATYPYVWVLGDDDFLNFDKCEDFIQAIESEKFDLIICSSERYLAEDSLNEHPTPDDEPISEYIRRNSGNNCNYLENTTQELALIIKEHYFSITGFLSSTIYKTSLIDSEFLIKGSYYIGRCYPHFPLIAKSLEENRLTYKTKHDIVFKRVENDWERTGLIVFAGYLDCLTLIKDKKIRSYAEKINGHRSSFQIPASIVYSKAKHDPDVKIGVQNIICTMYKLKGWWRGFLYHLYLLLFYSIPTVFCEYYVKKRTKINE